MKAIKWEEINQKYTSNLRKNSGKKICGIHIIKTIAGNQQETHKYPNRKTGKTMNKDATKK